MAPAAWLSDKLGRKAVVVPASAALAGAALALPLAPSYESFMGAVALWAAGTTMLGSAPTAFVADITSDAERGQALALLRSSGDAGLMIGATTLSAIADAVSLEAAFGSASLLLLGAGAHFAIRAKEPTRGKQPSDS